MSLIKDREDTMSSTTLAARVRGLSPVGGDTSKRGLGVRVIITVLLAALIVPALMMAFSSAAFADEEDRENYSMYNLASNASTYFSEKNSPSTDDKATFLENWGQVMKNPATGGSMLGYADPEFSIGDVTGWLFAEISGSSETISYDSFKYTPADGEGNAYQGLLDYAHFGAANRDLGLDSMTPSAMGDIAAKVGGSIMWLAYLMSLFVSLVFWCFIQLLKLLNPFSWFYLAIKNQGVRTDENGKEVEPGAEDQAHYDDMAKGMTGGDSSGGALAGLQNWIDDWYGLLLSISWEALVPLFIGFLLVGLFLFKKTADGRDRRAGMLKKFAIRLIFIGVGLPLVGSMYTAVLDKFDDSLLGQHAGTTRVVLTTYVDFNAWMNNERLRIPENASIGWKDGQADSNSMMNVRSTALAINKASHSEFSGISDVTGQDTVEDAWSQGLKGMEEKTTMDDASAVFGVFGILGNYIGTNEIAASDFESSIKTSVDNIPDDVSDNATKRSWFIDKNSYGDVKRFGEEKGPKPNEHPIIATGEMGSDTGLTADHADGVTTFSSTNVEPDCGYKVRTAEGNVSCNLAPLAAYNYLNTSFDNNSMVMYSSNNASAGTLRENHMMVSQVGTGPAKFMYWHNAVTVLGCIVLLGFWYAFGMLFGAIKRTFGLVAAIPFATLGAIAAISKVVVYTGAMILEIIVTLFMYQFVSELLISIPGIVAGPMSSLMSGDGLFGSAALSGIAVVAVTLLSSILIMVITLALLRARKAVLQALDEVVTNLVDKFMETNNAPSPSKGGMMPALAGGLGAGAGMAAGQKIASGMSGMGKPKGGGPKPGGGNGGGGQKTQPTNAGGTYGPMPALAGAGGGKGEASALEAGDGPDGGGDGGDRSLTGGTTDSSRMITASGGDDGRDGHDGGDGDSSDSSSIPHGTGHADRATAQNLHEQGGLSNLGYGGGKGGDQPITMEKGPDGVYRAAGDTSDSAQGGAGGQGQSQGRSGHGVSKSGDQGQTQFGLGAGQGTGDTKGGSRELTTGGGQGGGRERAGQRQIDGQGQTQFGTGQPGSQSPQGQSGQQGRTQTPGGQQAGPSGSTSGGRKVIAGQTTPTKFGQGGQSQTGAVSGTPVAGAGAAGGAALGAAGAAAKPRPGQRPAAQAPAAPAGTGRPAPSVRPAQGGPAVTTPQGRGSTAAPAQGGQQPRVAGGTSSGAVTPVVPVARGGAQPQGQGPIQQRTGAQRPAIAPAPAQQGGRQAPAQARPSVAPAGPAKPQRQAPAQRTVNAPAKPAARPGPAAPARPAQARPQGQPKPVNPTPARTNRSTGSAQPKATPSTGTKAPTKRTGDKPASQPVATGNRGKGKGSKKPGQKPKG